jgi:hypothetical protein
MTVNEVSLRAQTSYGMIFAHDYCNCVPYSVLVLPLTGDRAGLGISIFNCSARVLSRGSLIGLVLGNFPCRVNLSVGTIKVPSRGLSLSVQRGH